MTAHLFEARAPGNKSQPRTGRDMPESEPHIVIAARGIPRVALVNGPRWTKAR
ncbi:hypothetical protein M2361_001194 [Achromobacter sp. JUb104]|nr:hypothetical protein [Achromobacter sp. JUb104]